MMGAMTDEFDIPSPEYEQACLEAVRDALGGLDEQRDGVLVDSIELVHEGDDHRIVATIRRRGALRKIEWHLYVDAFSGIPPAGKAEPPAGVGTQMMVWAVGG
jgi:hypothetical protein